MTKYEIIHVDTCLSGYWSGDHRPVIQIPIYRPMLLKELKEDLLYEVNSCWDFYSDLDMDALAEAIEGIELSEGQDPEEHKLFSHLEFPEDWEDEQDWNICYAFFVVEEVEND